MKHSLDVITIGEAMAMFVATQTGDLAEVENFITRVAGAELNVATGLARLGLKVAWVSRVGNDSFGRMVLNTLQKRGLMPVASVAIATTQPAFSLNLRLKMEPIPLWNISVKAPPPVISHWTTMTRAGLPVHVIYT